MSAAKFSCQTSCLHDIIHVLTPIISRNPQKILHGCIKISGKTDNSITITGTTDGYAQMYYMLDNTPNTLPQDGIAINFDKFSSACKSLDGNDCIQCEYNAEKASLYIRSKSNVYFTLHAQDGKNFPEIPTDTSMKELRYSADKFLYCLKACAASMASMDVRHHLNGIYMHLNATRLSLYATDGYRLSHSNYTIERQSCPTSEWIIHRKVVLTLQRLLTGLRGDIRLSVKPGKTMRIASDIWQYTFALIDATYPPIAKLIPDICTSRSGTLSVRNLLVHLKRTAVFLRDSIYKDIIINMHDQQLSIEAIDRQHSEESVKSTLTLENYQGDDFRVRYNVEFLINILSVCCAETVIFSITDMHSRPVLKNSFRIEETRESDTTIHMVMPVADKNRS